MVEHQKLYIVVAVRGPLDLRWVAVGIIFCVQFRFQMFCFGRCSSLAISTTRRSYSDDLLEISMVATIASKHVDDASPSSDIFSTQGKQSKVAGAFGRCTRSVNFSILKTTCLTISGKGRTASPRPSTPPLPLIFDAVDLRTRRWPLRAHARQLSCTLQILVVDKLFLNV